MKYETFTYIEVENLEHEWAVELNDCKQEMKPVIPMYIYVHNENYIDIIYISNTLRESVPKKNKTEVADEISDIFKEVGFWKIKYK